MNVTLKKARFRRKMDARGMKFSHKKTKNKTFCSVFGCAKVRFHKFPDTISKLLMSIL